MRRTRAASNGVRARRAARHLPRGRGFAPSDTPAGTLALAPAGAANPEPGRLRGLRVEWSDARVLLRLYAGRVDAAATPPRPAYDVYMDFNHVVDAGSTNLLDGRGAYAAPRDAWEYALSIAGT